MTIMTPDSLTPENQMPVKLDPGDVCIAASYATGTPDIRRNSGEGRVLVYDENFNLKGALWTGRTGLVLGLAYCPLARELYVSDSSAKSIDRFSCAGELLSPHPDQQGKPFGTMACAHSGGLVTGEHIKGDKFPFIGGGEIYAFNQNGTQTGVYACERDPGKFGFHGVTSLVLENEDKIVTYISETGRRVMRYDLENNCQMQDAFVFPADDKITTGLARTSEGNYLISCAVGVDLYSPKGDLLKSYDIPKERGWAPVSMSVDGASFYIANFFTGVLQKRCLEKGDVLQEVETGLVFKLAAICEIVS